MDGKKRHLKYQCEDIYCEAVKTFDPRGPGPSGDFVGILQEYGVLAPLLRAIQRQYNQRAKLCVNPQQEVKHITGGFWTLPVVPWCETYL